MKINVEYKPNTRHFGNALKLEHEWRMVDGHLKAIPVYKRILIDLTDIPF